jgi:3-oxoacyl-[acyl-carrier-protein] synthase-3
VPKAKISALGCYVPPQVLTNSDLEKLVQTSNQWILERTGISERHIAGPEMATSDLALNAAKAALAQRGIEASELDAILVCTVTPDMLFPSTACLVQHQLGAKGAWGFDLIAACSGFVFGLTTAAQLVISGGSSTTPTAPPASCSATGRGRCWSRPAKTTRPASWIF